MNSKRYSSTRSGNFTAVVCMLGANLLAKIKMSVKFQALWMMHLANTNVKGRLSSCRWYLKKTQDYGRVN